jgi:hypothetical protein
VDQIEEARRRSTEIYHHAKQQSAHATFQYKSRGEVGVDNKKGVQGKYGRFTGKGDRVKKGEKNGKENCDNQTGNGNAGNGAER